MEHRLSYKTVRPTTLARVIHFLYKDVIHPKDSANQKKKLMSILKTFSLIFGKFMKKLISNSLKVNLYLKLWKLYKLSY